ncbi:TetR/AcrR family transcriptional regulator [Nocardia asteroides]|uniref:TetR/AcrR family transcriptional regulator n=1 Tax=Nocardia asteroides TaxID=1824 RepID=UPI001E567AE4|nr:TetR/AcrR family transcriptional regulator [Nocardia asteroides]UGT62588.1 TetR/AcrR family transcriptional regulator [Nocardia asteroides]
MSGSTGRTRDSARDARISTAALELLRERGPRAVTVEAVAAAAGVAKTTIYRRYRDREEMLISALGAVARPAPPADPATPVAVLGWIVEQCVHAVAGGIGLGGVAALLTGQDPAFTTAIRAVLVDHRAALAEVLGSPATAEWIRPELDAETVLDLVVGAYLSEHARSGGVGPDWQTRVLTTLWPALSTATPPAELTPPGTGGSLPSSTG